jgi:hypothetical protein
MIYPENGRTYHSFNPGSELNIHLEKGHVLSTLSHYIGPNDAIEQDRLGNDAIYEIEFHEIKCSFRSSASLVRSDNGRQTASSTPHKPSECPRHRHRNWNLGY